MKTVLLALALAIGSPAFAGGFTEAGSPAKPARLSFAETKVGSRFWVYLDTPACQSTLWIRPKPDVSDARKYQSAEPLQATVVGALDDGMLAWLKLELSDGGTGYLMALKAPKMEPLKEGDDLRWRCYSLEAPDEVSKFKEAEAARKDASAQACQAAGYRRGIPEVGMNEWDLTNCALGKPDSINRTTTAAGVKEQWVYSARRTYVYLEGGKVTAIQN